MIPSLATIVAAYVILRCVEIILRPESSFSSPTSHLICLLLAIIVIGITGFELYAILQAGAKVADALPVFLR